MCNAHAQQRVTCSACKKQRTVNYVIEKARARDDTGWVRRFVAELWGEGQQLAFGREFNPVDHVAYYGRAGNSLIAFISLAEDEGDLIIVALGVYPEYQRSGIGTSLVEKAELEARRSGKKRMLVSTSNDNLPALGFYQALGFQVFEVEPNAIARKHGKILAGIGGLPIRDELRLLKILS